MASAPQVGVEESSMNCLPYKNAMPKCSFETSSQNALHKRRNSDESLQLEEASDDEFSDSDQPAGSVYKALNPIDERLRTLQHLLPHGLELEEDEILRVAADYVKELEREIKMFNNSTEGCSTLGEGMDDSPLQKRGLCIVPRAALAKAL